MCVGSGMANRRGVYRLLLKHRWIILWLKTAVNNEAGLPSHGVEDSENARTVGDRLHERLEALLELLAVEACAWTYWRLVCLPDGPSKVQAAELL